MHAADGLQEVQLQFTQSRSVVADADMAAGSANLAKAQVLYDASQRVMGIAHRASDAEFRLMRDTFRALG
jgi:flagellin-like hook-associated protein FlgL